MTNVGDRLYCWKDLSANPSTVYTTSEIISTGMALYDETGASTGKVISTINQDGSFDIGTPYTLTFSIYGSSVAAPTVTLTYNDETTTLSNNDTFSALGTCKIDATSEYYIHIKIDETQVAGGYYAATYTFVPSSNCTITVYTDDR